MKRIFPFLFLLLLFITGCHKKTETPTEDKTTSSSSAPKHSHVQEADTTLYGMASNDFGMSTFALITERGDTLSFMRSHEDGSDAVFYGDVVPGHSYALTATDGGNSVAEAINLTQLEAITKDYAIHNAHLILHPDTQPDTVVIERLDDKQLVACGKQTYRLSVRR